jgi:hypothetical protein
MMRHLPINACVLLLTLAPSVYAQPTEPDAAEGAPASTPAPANVPAASASAAAPANEPTPSAQATPAPLTSPQPTPSTTPRARIASAAARSAAHTQPAAVTESAAVDLDEGPSVAAAPLPAISAWLGFGSVWLPSDGLDPFAEDDALLMFSAGAALSLAPAGPLDVAAVAGWDITSTDESYRGEATSLGLMRFALGPELRGSIIDRLFWHGRIAPTLTRLSVELDESSSNATLAQSRWLWGAEAALGLDFRFADARVSAARALGIFARIEAGYAWSTSSKLQLEATGDNAPVRTEPLALGELALAGPTFKASLGAGF